MNFLHEKLESYMPYLIILLGMFIFSFAISLYLGKLIGFLSGVIYWSGLTLFYEWSSSETYYQKWRRGKPGLNQLRENRED